MVINLHCKKGYLNKFISRQGDFGDNPAENGKIADLFL
jgi:hypothetical protein